MQPQDITFCCTRCGETKPITEFHRNKASATGHVSRCKSCIAHLNHLHHIKNADRIRARRMATYAANREVFAQRWAKWYTANQSRRSKSETARAAQWVKDHPEAATIIRRSISAVQQALRTGRLIRPAACEQCGRICKPQGAHHDYSLPLDVRWLCRSCHSRWDMAEPKIMGKHIAS